MINGGKMENTDLMSYKPERITLEKSFISRLNETIQTLTEEWNGLSSIAKTIYRVKYDNLLTDATKKLKESITGLREMKKKPAEEIIKIDIQNIIDAESNMPTSKNSFAWLTAFRSLFGQVNCFVRESLFKMIDCKSLYSEEVVTDIKNRELPNLNNKSPFEQAQTVIDMVSKMYSVCNGTSNNDINEEEVDIFEGNIEQLQMPLM